MTRRLLLLALSALFLAPAAFPAEAARQLEWTAVPLMSATEIDVPGALSRCIRVLMLWNSSRSQEQVRHVYLRDAEALRPDLRKG